MITIFSAVKKPSRIVLCTLALLGLMGVAMALACYDGELDQGFSNDGVFTHNTAGASDRAYDTVARDDGKILAVGRSGGDALGLLLSPYGDLVLQLEEGADWGEAFYGVALQDDNMAVAVGVIDPADDGQRDFFLVRYQEDGTLDPAFGTDGMVSLDFAAGDDQALAVALQDDGKIVVAGVAENNLGESHLALARFNDDGSLDTAFGTDGMVHMQDYGASEAQDVAVDEDGKIVVAGYAEDGVSGEIDFLVMRFNADGTVDDTFGPALDGKALVDFGDVDQAYALGLTSDGKIAVAGSTGDATVASDIALALLDANGDLDTDFDTDGMVTTDLNTVDVAYDLYMQTDDKILVTGRTGGADDCIDIPVLRYNTDGSLEEAWRRGIVDIKCDPGDDDGCDYEQTGDTSIMIIDLGGNDIAQAMTAQRDGKLVLAGYKKADDNDDSLFVARLYYIVPGVDSDGDGVPDDEDDYPYDNRKATVYSITGSGKFLVDVSETDGAYLIGVNVYAKDDDALNQDGMPDEVEFKDGLIGFTIMGVEWGGTAVVIITPPTELEDGAEFYWVGRDGYVDYGASCEVLDGKVHITLTDGGDGDMDEEVNGVIVDPFGPAWGDSSGSSGGCTMGMAGNGLMWALLALAPVLALIRRKR